jgi:aminoglycoside phosphotransferase (APT) family kinase protein
MPLSTERLEASQVTDSAAGLRQLAALPDWLVAPMKPETVIAALERHGPEFAAGELKIRRCKGDVRLKGERWEAQYELTVGNADGAPDRELAIDGALTPPGVSPAEPPTTGGVFGGAEWRCHLPELGLELWMAPQEQELEALPILTDPEQARAFLEQSIRAGAPSYADLRIKRVTPKVMRNKPGRCTVRYQLEYDAEPSVAAGWPALVIGKTYSGTKGQNAYAGMRALWASPLSKGDVVAIAEPLAYIPEHKVLVQGPVRGEQDLKDLLRSALRAGTAEALDELHRYTRKTAAGLAALHHSGARHGQTIAWDDELAEIREEIEKLGAVFPWFTEAMTPLLAHLVSSAAAHPAEPSLPAHHSFRPQQVLLGQGQIGFIDFDGFGLAEPALDIALFRATVKEMGINTSPSDKQKEFEYPDEAARLARLAQLDTICEVFLAEYGRLAPVSRQRVALWEALYLLTVVLRCWTKVKPHQLSNAMLLLEQHLRENSLSPA